MPLCPQITNTPITVSLTGDFTVTNVLPTGKNKTWYQTTAPTAGMLEGDLWVDTDDKNKMYRYTSGSWVSVQDGTIADASAEAAAAEAAAIAAEVEAAAAAAAAASASSAAAAAAAAAGAAQSTATTALANAATAYNAAIGSLQPSASTIVNASNQITAIASNGITVYSGASSSSGARVVLNSLGLAGYNAGGTATFSISATTGAAVFSGSVTGSTITGGTLNIAGNAIIDASGLLTATGATITGEIRGTSGYFGTSTNGFSISSTGLVGVGTGTIVGGTISGATFINGSGTFSVSSAGYLIAQSGQIGGSTFTSTSITGGIIQTSSGSNAVVLDGANNALGIKYGGNYAGWLVGIGSGQFMMHYGTSPSSVGYPRAAVSSTTASLAADGSNSLSVTTSGNNMAGTMRFFSTVQVDGTLTTNSIVGGTTGSLFEFLSSSGNVRVAQTYNNSVSGRSMQISSAGLYGTTASTLRKKHEIQSYKIDSNALLNLDVKTFKYKPEIDAEQSVQYGFIAEEAQELGLDELIQYDETGVPDYFAYEKLPIFLLQLAQEQEARIQALEGK